MTTLIERLRCASTGYKEWRVQNPSDGAYCMSFCNRDSINPEREAREWLEDHQRAFPKSMFSQYVVACVDTLTNGDKLTIEAADALERLTAELDRATEAHAAELADMRAERDKALAAQVEGLTKGLDGLRVDAERYRWLREQAIDGSPGVPVIAMPNGMKSGYYLNFDTADYAIDAARKAAP